MNLSKKVILIGSLLLAVIFFLTPGYPYNQCLIVETCNNPLLQNLSTYTIFFIPVFVFSTVTYFLNEKTFLLWRKFTLWWLAISFFFISISPTELDNFFGNIKEGLALISAGGYAIFATILILVKSWKLHKAKP